MYVLINKNNIDNKNKNSLNYKIKFKITKSLVGNSDTPNMVNQIRSKDMMFLRVSDFSNICRALFLNDLCFDFIWLVITTNGIAFVFEYHIV